MRRVAAAICSNAGSTRTAGAWVLRASGGTARWAGDDGQELHLGDGCAGDVDALGVGAGVGWHEEEAGVFDEGIEQGAVGGGEAFELVAGAEGQAEPEAFAARAGQES